MAVDREADVTYRGTVRSGVVVLPDGVALPEGAEVEVTLPGETAPGLGDRLAALGRWAETLPTDLPPDLAANHDHHLHKLPKRQ
jgi:hypothetical protein